jgi:hypothetical protein
VWTHLKRLSVRDDYTSTWWNARGRLAHPAATSDLPKKPGETVQAPN